MLLEMRVKTIAARGLCYQVAEAIDRAHMGHTAEDRAMAEARASLLTPVAKAFATDISVEVASIGVQVHGGMGFVEETGAAQHLRDARILPIYEGTNGIQAIDLVTRKLPVQGGAVVRSFIGELRLKATDAGRSSAALARPSARILRTIDVLETATSWMLAAVASQPGDALAGATAYLRLFALAASGVNLLREASGTGDSADVEKVAFFASQLASAAEGLAEAATAGAESLGSAAIA
jgi:hypothetical protein